MGFRSSKNHDPGGETILKMKIPYPEIDILIISYKSLKWNLPGKTIPNNEDENRLKTGIAGINYQDGYEKSVRNIKLTVFELM